MNRLLSLTSRLCLGLALLAQFFLGSCPAEEAPARVVVRWRDGTTTEAQTILGWRTYHPKRHFPSGHTMKLDGAMIGERRLFNPKNPVRNLRNVNVQSVLKGPFVQLANGDVLPGSVALGAAKAAQRSGYVSVAVRPPLTTWSEDHLARVRIESIARIVLTAPTGRPLSPGLVVYRDGREVIAKDVKWRPEGIQLLLDRSVVTAAWDQLADVHLPRHDRITAILRDSSSQSSRELDLLGRVTTKSGAVLTHHRDRMLCAHIRWKYYHVLQPAWADNGILVETDNIASVDYRELDEVPLSLLPAHTLAQRNLTGFTWKWWRNRNIRGGPLSIGKLSAALGVGTHSHSEIAFELPPGAVSFSSWVGIDNCVGQGGCVRCKVFRDRVAGKPVWTSGIIRGGDEPVRVEVADLAKTKRLVLVTEFADADHPADADPLDIGDAVSWLRPTVRVNLPKPAAASVELADLFPQLHGWSLSESMKERISSRTQFNRKEGRWGHAMVLDAGNSTGPVEPLVVTRKIDVNVANAWLLASTARDGHGAIGYRVTVDANSTKVPGTEGFDSNTSGYAHGQFDPVAYSLGKYAGQTVSLSVTATPAKDDRANLAGIIWGELSLSPLIQGLPTTGQPIEPDVAVETVKSLKVAVNEDAALRKAASLSGDLRPRLRFFQMKSGLTIPPDVKEVTCLIDPRWKRFVACIGPAALSTGKIESFQVWIEEELVWQSQPFTRLSPCEQIDIRLPAEKTGKRLKLRVVNGSRDYAVWANAGFMVE